MYDYGYSDYGYGYSDYGSAAGSILGGFAVMLIFCLMVSLILSILMYIGQWKCFKKAGYKGWEIFIPWHSQFVNCTFAGVNPILILVFLFGYLVVFIPIIGWLVYLGFLIYYQIVVGINTAKVFGRGIGFGIALAIPLSAPIAWFLLGRDDFEYIGPKSNDNINENIVQPSQPVVTEVPVVEPLNTVSNFEPTVNQNSTPSFCTNCGNALLPGTKFCTKCGKQI